MDPQDSRPFFFVRFGRPVVIATDSPTDALHRATLVQLRLPTHARIRKKCPVRWAAKFAESRASGYSRASTRTHARRPHDCLLISGFWVQVPGGVPPSD